MLVNAGSANYQVLTAVPEHRTLSCSCKGGERHTDVSLAEKLHREQICQLPAFQLITITVGNSPAKTTIFRQQRLHLSSLETGCVVN